MHGPPSRHDSLLFIKEQCKWGQIYYLHVSSVLRNNSDSDLSALMSRLPEHLENADAQIFVAEVFEWRVDNVDLTDFIPYALNTLYQIDRFDSPSETD